MPSQGIGCFLQYSIGTPMYVSERLRQKAVTTKPDKVISAIKRWTNDTVKSVEKPKCIANDLLREIRYIASYEENTAKPYGEGVIDTIFHFLAKIITFLGQVLVLFSQERFEPLEGILRVDAYKEGVISFL